MQTFIVTTSGIEFFRHIAELPRCRITPSQCPYREKEACMELEKWKHKFIPAVGVDHFIFMCCKYGAPCLQGWTNVCGLRKNSKHICFTLYWNDSIWLFVDHNTEEDQGGGEYE